MTWFSARNISMSTVPVARQEIWAQLIDPRTLAELTPLVRSIEASGSTWRWTLNGVRALGMTVEAVFTERMEFTDNRRIVFTHDPPPTVRERAAVEGTYDLEALDPTTTHLAIDLTLAVDLPLTRLSRHIVEPVLTSTMRVAGQGFAANLYRRLGLDPADADINELAQPIDEGRT